MRKQIIILLLLIGFWFASGFQVQEPLSWQDVFKGLIMLAVAAGGAPITTLVKNLLAKVLKRPIEDKAALAVTGAIAAIIAVLVMWLSGLLDFNAVTVQSFPATFFAVFSVATVYYKLLCGSESFFGKGFLLKKSDVPTPEPLPIDSGRM